MDSCRLEAWPTSTTASTSLPNDPQRRGSGPISRGSRRRGRRFLPVPEDYRRAVDQRDAGLKGISIGVVRESLVEETCAEAVRANLIAR